EISGMRRVSERESLVVVSASPGTRSEYAGTSRTSSKVRPVSVNFSMLRNPSAATLRAGEHHRPPGHQVYRPVMCAFRRPIPLGVPVPAGPYVLAAGEDPGGRRSPRTAVR